MNIAKIVSITPDGKPFTTANGTFHPFVVAFDDHRSGQANSKSNPPPWRVGEVVGYTVAGQTPRGMDKFKITRNPDPAEGSYQPPAGADEHLEGDPITASYGGILPLAGTNPQTGRTASQMAPSEMRHPPKQADRKLVSGVMAGGTLARAVEIAIAQNRADDLAFIEATASRLIAIQFRLEGWLASEDLPF